MATRPATAASAISSALSDDVDVLQPQSSSRATNLLPRPPPSQQGYRQTGGPSEAILRPHPISGGEHSNIAASNRSQSPASHVTRTHIPSLAAHGFFRPMSSQRLQAQRLGRPNTAKTARTTFIEDQPEGVDTHIRASMSTMRHGPRASMPEHERLPPSRGTEVTGSSVLERGTTADSLGNVPGRSLTEGTRLINGGTDVQHMSSSIKPQRLNLGGNLNSGIAQDSPQRSPHSFRSGLSIASRRSNYDSMKHGHQQLPSNASSPRHPPAPTLPKSEKLGVGRNFEYFEGNTVFCWGGRLQNARDRPVNVATGLLLVLPSILFLAFSYVARPNHARTVLTPILGDLGYGIIYHPRYPYFLRIFSSRVYRLSSMLPWLILA